VFERAAHKLTFVTDDSVTFSGSHAHAWSYQSSDIGDIGGLLKILGEQAGVMSASHPEAVAGSGVLIAIEGRFTVAAIHQTPAANHNTDAPYIFFLKKFGISSGSSSSSNSS
jgi:hypothetical protein